MENKSSFNNQNLIAKSFSFWICFRDFADLWESWPYRAERLFLFESCSWLCTVWAVYLSPYSRKLYLSLWNYDT